jgi:ABC-type cobalamin/Fe3+-siderophores transport system ATPase subunit
MRAADRAYLLRDGIRVGEGASGAILTKAQLERLYGTSVETVNDSTGRTAFLPG